MIQGSNDGLGHIFGKHVANWGMCTACKHGVYHGGSSTVVIPCWSDLVSSIRFVVVLQRQAEAQCAHMRTCSTCMHANIALRTAFSDTACMFYVAHMQVNSKANAQVLPSCMHVLILNMHSLIDP